MKIIFKISFVTIYALFSPVLAVETKPQIVKDREGHKTEIIKKTTKDLDLAVPPTDSGFKLIKYPTKLGLMSAYLSHSKEPSQDRKLPAIIWLTGGFPTASPGDYLWQETSIDNEQSARIYRLEGITMMFPTVRGSAKGNPGFSESFYGEVDDVIAAYEYLSKVKSVDPKRIYLGGHSTGGTLALLCAAAFDKFAGVISLGPTDTDYGEEKTVYSWNEKERKLRHPINYINTIKVPTYIIEGEHGNSDSLTALKSENKNPMVNIISIDKADHFNCIHPVNNIFQKAIKTSTNGSLLLNQTAIQNAYTILDQSRKEQSDLRRLADYRRENIKLFVKPQSLTFYFYADDITMFEKFSKKAKNANFTVNQPEEKKTKTGEDYILITMEKIIDCSDLNELFEARAKAQALANDLDLEYGDWGME